MEEGAGVGRFNEGWCIELFEAKTRNWEGRCRPPSVSTRFRSGRIGDEGRRERRNVEVPGDTVAFTHGQDSDSTVPRGNPRGKQIFAAGIRNAGREDVVPEGFLRESDGGRLLSELSRDVGPCIRVAQDALTRLHRTALGVQGAENHLTLGCSRIVERQIVQLDLFGTTERQLEEFQRIQLFHGGESKIHTRNPVKGLGEVLDDGTDGELPQGASEWGTISTPTGPLDRVGNERFLTHRCKTGGVWCCDVQYGHLCPIGKHNRPVGCIQHTIFGIVASRRVDAGAEPQRVVDGPEDSRIVKPVDVLQDETQTPQEIRVLQLGQLGVGFVDEQWIVWGKSRDIRWVDGEVVVRRVARGACTPIAVECLVFEDISTQRNERVNQLVWVDDTCVSGLYERKPAFGWRLLHPLRGVEPLEGGRHPDEGYTFQRMHIGNDDRIHRLLGDRGGELPIRQGTELYESVSFVRERTAIALVVEGPDAPVDTLREPGVDGHLTVHQVQAGEAASAVLGWRDALHETEPQDDVGVTTSRLVALLPPVVELLHLGGLLVRLCCRLFLLPRCHHHGEHQNWYQCRQVLQF